MSTNNLGRVTGMLFLLLVLCTGLYAENTPPDLHDIRAVRTEYDALAAAGVDADAHLDSLATAYLATLELPRGDMQALKDFLHLARRYAMAEQYYPDELWKFSEIGDRYYDLGADSLEQWIVSGLVSPEDPTARQLIYQLQERQYHINLPTSNYDKAYGYLMQGRFDYLWRRLWGRYPLVAITLIIGVVGTGVAGVRWGLRRWG